jgi:subtilisin family serine protease
VAASGWLDLATEGWQGNVGDPTDPNDFFIATYSSRSISSEQDLDVTAPGSSVVGPYQVNGQISYYYLSGTSMASPHVAGVVALLAQKNTALTAAEAESILEGTALEMPGWSSSEAGAGLVDAAAALTTTP